MQEYLEHRTFLVGMRSVDVYLGSWRLKYGIVDHSIFNINWLGIGCLDLFL